jgi:AcrR family transcriptional regulator
MPPIRDSVPRRLRADARDNRRRLLEAAREVFIERGPEAPLEEIARRAGTGIATLYRRFPDRRALVREVVLDALQRTAEEARRAAGEEPDPFVGLARYMHRALDLRTAAVIPALLGEISFDNEEVTRAREAGLAAVQALVDAAHRAGTLRPDVTSGDIGMLIVRLSRPLPGGFPPEVHHRLSHRHLSLVIDGLRASALQPAQLGGPALTLADLREFPRPQTQAPDRATVPGERLALGSPADSVTTGRAGRIASVADRTEGIALPPFETEFAHAWDHPGHTHYQLPDIDVNKVLATRYSSGGPLAFTRGMLWEMEVRKAASPGTYIPSVVQGGSDQSWNRHRGDGGEYLDRCSMQRLWRDPQRHELILERAFLNHDEQKITFLGVPQLTGPDGTLLRAGTGQPLFHVEHSVGGTDAQPLNRWRIVHHTNTNDTRLLESFAHMAASPWLAEHTEIYIRHDLGIELIRKPA